MKKRFIKNTFASVLFVFASLFTINQSQAPAAAAETGCYTESGGSFTKINCPTEGLSRAISQFQACYVLTGATTAEERNCADLTKIDNKVPAPGVIPTTPAAPGCYTTAAAGLYKKVSCPTPELLQRAVDAKICFVVAADKIYTQKTCGSIALEEVDTPNDSSETSGGAILESDCDQPTLNKDNCQIVAYLVNGINFLTALAGMAIVASIMIAGYQYMTARDNSGQVEAAKKRILWAMIALGMLIFMYAFLNWVVPGGVIGL